MSVPPTGDVLSVILVVILLACVIGLIAYVWIKLGNKKAVIKYRNIDLHLNAALPANKVVLIDAASAAIGEATFDKLDAMEFPRNCAGILLSTADYATLLSRQTDAVEVPASQQMQA